MIETQCETPIPGPIKEGESRSIVILIQGDFEPIHSQRIPQRETRLAIITDLDLCSRLSVSITQLDVRGAVVVYADLQPFLLMVIIENEYGPSIGQAEHRWEQTCTGPALDLRWAQVQVFPVLVANDEMFDGQGFTLCHNRLHHSEGRPHGARVAVLPYAALARAIFGWLYLATHEEQASGQASMPCVQGQVWTRSGSGSPQRTIPSRHIKWNIGN